MLVTFMEFFESSFLDLRFNVIFFGSDRTYHNDLRQNIYK